MKYNQNSKILEDMEEEIKTLLERELKEEEILNIIWLELFRLRNNVTYEILDLQEQGTTSEIIEPLIYLKKKELSLDKGLNIINKLRKEITRE